VPRTATSAIDAKLFGLTLRRARTDRGLTQAAVAERLGVTTAYLQKLEGGRANPTLGQLANIARALGGTLSIQFMPQPAPVDPLEGLAAGLDTQNNTGWDARLIVP
jgi:putative transcriptional regulator